MSRLQAIRELQKQLSETYARQSSNKLTDRNVADIIVQLLQDGDMELYYTVDGLEYVTPRQLWKEIEREVAEQGGRRTIFGLQSILCVDAQHIDRVVNRNTILFNATSSSFSHHASLAAASGGPNAIDLENQPSLLFSDSVFYLADSNELINGSFNAHMVLLFNEQLKVQGIASLQEFSSLHSLPYMYIERLAQCAILAQMIPGTELDSANRALITEETKRKVVSHLRTALCACTRPISVQKLITQHPNIYTTPALVNDAIDILKREPLGSFEMVSREKVIFYPQIFLKARTSWINAALVKDMFISTKDLAKLGISSPKQSDFTQTAFVLPLSVVSGVLIDQLEAAIVESSHENNILGISSPLIPDGLAKEDIKVILSQNLSNSISEHGRLVADHYFLPNGLITRCYSLFQQHISEKFQASKERAETDSHIISPSTSFNAASSDLPQVNLNFVFDMIRKWCPQQRKYELALRTMAEILLPQILALSSSSRNSPTVPAEVSSWKGAEWAGEFEPIYLNLFFFLKSVELLPTVVSPDQRVQLLQYALEALGKEVLKKLREAYIMKYLVGTENTEDFQIFPSEVAKPLNIVFELTTGGDKHCTLKCVSKCVEDVLKELGCAPPKLDEKTKETILDR